MKKIFCSAAGIILYVLVFTYIQSFAQESEICVCVNKSGNMAFSESGICKPNSSLLCWNAEGQQGPPGECTCPITQAMYDELLDRLYAIECHDYDADGYSVGALCEGVQDCDDNDENINPGATEILDNEIDENCDGLLTARFTDNADGTILDNGSGLIWLRDASCADLAGTDANGKANWGTAKAAAADLSDGICGLTDSSEAGNWRLPTPAEWQAFMSTVYDNPALVNTLGDAQWTEGDAFTGVQSDEYWSSSEVSTQYAWVANMSNGNIGDDGKSVANYVWPVRGPE
jgi:hypothetical protein